MVDKISKQNLDQKILDEIVKYAKMLSMRGYVSNTLGTIAIRAQHPHRPEESVVYTKRAEISLEEMAQDDVAVTSIPNQYEIATRGGELLCGDIAPSVGHQLNLEIFRYRPDISAIIHVHPEAIIAFSAAGHDKFEYISADLPLVMGKPVYVLPQNVNVELDVTEVKDFIEGTNAVILQSHGVTVLGRYMGTKEIGSHVSEAYNRLSTLVRDVRAFMKADIGAKLEGRKVQVITPDEVEDMFRQADKVIYPSRV